MSRGSATILENVCKSKEGPADSGADFGGACRCDCNVGDVRTTARGKSHYDSQAPSRRNGLSLMSWSRTFDDPIVLPDGRKLVTLRDAGDYITKLPKAEHEAAEWQTAMEALILVATHGGPTMLARIGVMRALNRNVEHVFAPLGKKHHWGAASWRASDDRLGPKWEFGEPGYGSSQLYSRGIKPVSGGASQTVVASV
jgi:hypothetical protein